MTFLPYQLLNQQGIALKRFLYNSQSRTNLRKNCFTNRVASFWNRLLPINYKTAQDINQFKNLIDNWKIYRDLLYSYDA